jgi:hypothetical protein
MSSERPERLLRESRAACIEAVVWRTPHVPNDVIVIDVDVLDALVDEGNARPLARWGLAPQ